MMEIVNKDEVLDFMAGSAMIFSGFAIMAKDLQAKVKEMEEKLNNNQIEWTTLSIIAKKIGLTKDAVRKQLQNGEFEEDVDFKYEGNKIVVHQGAIGRLRRRRRSNNG
jgi:predicted ArsR family transcriptional regulator